MLHCAWIGVRHYKLPTNTKKSFCKLAESIKKIIGVMPPMEATSCATVMTARIYMMTEPAFAAGCFLYIYDISLYPTSRTPLTPFIFKINFSIFCLSVVAISTRFTWKWLPG